MRLKSIKLAGFKSFVDPTTVTFTSNMSAVVGPNGCGKSNIIDAVRWVMGESSAKNLRGESMTDVIFNGSTARKPVGQASIELVFDNSAKTLKGEFAGYNEISVRRKVTREGDSSYFMNGTKCRRKDITDLFLGTGLGPRSYAIIEQGMISKLIEAKPQELRVFIEEAAGISRYKERRRDTENRIRRSRENLERLTDIREELERQLAHLNRQAKTAQRYKELKQQERDNTVLLWSVQWHSLMQRKQQSDLGVGELQVQLEALLTEKSRLGFSIDKQRLNLTEQNDRFNEVQGQFYSLSAAISRIEQQINHIGEREQQLKADLEQSLRALAELQGHGAADTQSEFETEQALEMIEPQIMEFEQQLELYQEQYEQLREQQLNVEEAWESFNAIASQAKTDAELEQNRCQFIEKNLLRLQTQQQSAHEAIAQLQGDAFQEERELAHEQRETLQLQLDEHSEQLNQSQSALRNARADQKQAEQGLREITANIQRLQGRQSALQALIENARTQGEAADQWLQQQQLANASRWAERLKVDEAWQQAVNAALHGLIDAVEIESLQQYRSGELPSGVRLYEPLPVSGAVNPASLAAQIKNDVYPAILDHVLCADSVAQAIDQRHTLESHQQFVTKEGHLIGGNWFMLPGDGKTEANLLHLFDELAVIEGELSRLLSEQEASNQALLDSEQLSQRLEQQQAELHGLSVDLNQQFNHASSELSRIDIAIEQRQRRLEEQNTEYHNICTQLEEERELLSEARLNLEALLDGLDAHQDQREALQEQREAVRFQLEEYSGQETSLKESVNELRMRKQLLQSQLDSARSARQRIAEQSASLEARIAYLQEQLDNHETNQPELEQELEASLAQRLEAEQLMAEVADQQAHIESEIKAFESQKTDIDTQEADLRSIIENQKLAAQTLTVELGHVSQQLMQSDNNPEDILAEHEQLPEEALLKESLEKLATSISRLGAINLAAIEEYEQQSERKRYLDQQNDDLVAALETLESAIRRIDKETRSRFKETFDEVNAGLGALFPQVFGGGQAYLELTDDDLLETGIAIMARPPGKRNSTIHLLSGGEKALTAIALVFAIFKLNPAPFCMLDEVDAPLDDANVARYARIVKSMSDSVQFIYITHNKIPMEQADQLMGVTMQEPGVSRLVSVDINKAAELAAL